ncbi:MULTISPECIES: GAF domain-containing protein [unclassified Lysobacter]|uniref:GAF domain-containing protein n=1 Tax=unclassified Lysobacter TaxID=2635362 RepID=UPI001BE9806E|nr:MULTISPECIES: GAF domain-containing protein [unclassified Lysobacter]MBT2748703.1 GAF domain-containing protein [Lysobacter sp. ISL-42]MBT2751638.1 GAF domain-containing protein [Lysobacter sp. ISL-50]MBT2775832.1 GAF domain-containing protein [Lysobacter sp. ISL-54]MBT2782203.1 GAF domain-containing protein [Lysobacter sp. ISL-52]
MNEFSEMERIADALAQSGDRADIYYAVETAMQHLVGHRLFTLLAILPGGSEMERFWSSNKAAYPLAGRKRIGTTPWSSAVLEGKKPWLGRTSRDIQWAFPDYGLIASLGLGSAINIPVVLHGQILGTMNLLHRENYFTNDHVKIGACVAPYLIPAFVEEIRAIEAQSSVQDPAKNTARNPP